MFSKMLSANIGHGTFASFVRIARCTANVRRTAAEWFDAQIEKASGVQGNTGRSGTAPETMRRNASTLPMIQHAKFRHEIPGLS